MATEQALEDPGYVARCLVIDAIKMFIGLTGREPEVVYIPPRLEVLWQHHARRLAGQPDLQLRSYTKLLGCRPVFDARYFRLEREQHEQEKPATGEEKTAANTAQIAASPS